MKETFNIKGMHCASCSAIISQKISNLDGVVSCDANYATEKATVEYDHSKVDLNKMNDEIGKLGYSLHNQMDHSKHLGMGQSKSEKLNELKDAYNKALFSFPLTIIVFAIMVWDITSQTFKLPEIPFMKVFIPITFVLSTIFLFWIGNIFIKGAFRFFKYGAANMDTLVGIGTITAYIYSSFILLFPGLAEQIKLPDHTYFDVVIVVIGFVTVGKYLEAKSKLQTGEAIEKLIGLSAKTAIVLRDKEIEIPIDQITLNEVIVIKPGGKIPVDGEILEGKSSIDESMITGEPIPVDKNIGDNVIGGTINKQGFLKIKATKIGKDTLLSQIIKMVESAQGSKAPIQKLADKVSSIFVPIVLIIAVLSLIGWLIIGSQFMPLNEAFSYGLLCFVSVLVIACPCALGLATPTGIIVGTGKGAQNGILIKNAESLEKLEKVKTIILDKTGTITKGKPEVTEIIEIVPKSFQIIASLEKNSEHPLADAVVKKANEMKIDFQNVNDFEIIEGKGLKGKINSQEYFVGNIRFAQEYGVDIGIDDKFTKEGKTPVFLFNKEKVLCIVLIADTIKDEAKQAIEELHKMGIKVAMLTGDNRNTAEYIARQVGIDEVVAEVLPNEKASKVQSFQHYGLVGMVGDGINDAPALATADVGIAMGSGSDIAIESAQITLLGGNISKLPKATKLSKYTMNIIRQNLFWAFIYNIIGIPLAAGLLYPFFGLLNPIFAGAAMAFSSLSVVLNSLRLKTKRL